ncbi:MAG: hypothetical protein ACM3VZ_11410 [Acidobacteriota bacterium]
MDNPSQESSALNVDGAASAFAELLDTKKDLPQGEQPDQAESEAPEEVEAQAETPEESAEDDPLVTIKVDGKEVQVPLSELKNGYQRQADYTRKTMEVSEQRKAAEAEAQRATQERQQYAASLQRMQAQLEVALQEQQKIDWEQLIQTDPQEYLKQKHLFEQRQAAWQQNIANQQQLAQAVEAEQNVQRQNHIKQQQEILLAKLPEWKDPKKAQAETLAIRQYLIDQGHDEQLVDTLADANMVLTARKAMLFDQMVSKAQAATKKVEALPQKVEKPGTGSSPSLDRRSASFQRLSKSGRIEDAASVFSTFL